jgi:N-acyl-D-amino-acid deacylase
MLSLLIRNGTVADGGGGAPFAADVAVENGRIAGVGRFPGARAALSVDAAGKWVTPGFLDIHRHGDAAAFRPGYGAAELMQGITTVVNGNCGLSAAPLEPRFGGAMRAYMSPILGELPEGVPCGSMADYLAALERSGPRLNVGMLLGAGTVRAGVRGLADGALADGEVRAVRAGLERGLADGALGVSLGLGYAPECFYDTEGLVRVLEPLRGGKTPITVHMRQEGDGMPEALAEMISVARALNAPVHISHLKAMGRRSWGVYAARALELISRAREEGLDVSCDAYPYAAGSTQLVHILPPEFLPGGTEAICARLRDPALREKLAGRLETGRDFENIVRLAGWDGITASGFRRPENAAYENRTLAEIADARGEDPLDACCALLAGEECALTMVDRMMDEDDVAAILRAPFANAISDATHPAHGRLHPRVYGAFSRVLETYVRVRRALTPEAAVAKLTALPAAALGLRDRGRLLPGFCADLAVFDPDKIRENATYAEPERFSGGMDWVFVGGTAAVAAGKLTGARAGCVLRAGEGERRA